MMNHLKKISLPVAVGALLLTSSLSSVAYADNSKRRGASLSFTEYAPVIGVQPVYDQIKINEPRQECWTEYEQHITGYKQSRGNRRFDSASVNGNAGGAILGGIIGGVIGNKLGRGSSRSSRNGATVAGAIIGSAIGNGTESNRNNNRRNRGNQRREARPIYENRPVERCKRVSETRYERRIRHYNVTYRYKGRTYNTQLPRDPGNRIELQVSVAPIRY